MTKQGLTLAGWLAITNAVLTIPIFVLSVVLATNCSAWAKFANVILALISLGLFIFILSSLKDLLNDRFNFRDIDVFITILIWVNVAVTIFNILGNFSSNMKAFIGIVSLILIVPLGIVSIIFAIKLLRLPDNLHGLLKPFAYTTIATGFFTASIILIFIAPFSSAVSDIILGIIFLRAAEN